MKGISRPSQGRAGPDPELTAPTGDIATVDSALEPIPGEFTRTGYRPPENLSHTRWLSLGATFEAMEASVMWWIGDWWRFGERKYGEMASQATRDELEKTAGLAYDTLRWAGLVAERFEFVERSTHLTWAHHKFLAELAGRDKPLALRWLAWAEQERWSAQRLRRELAGAQRSGVLPWADTTRVIPARPDAEVREGDFRAVLADLEDGSVDAIITDPPNGPDPLPLYESLAVLAARVLKPGGSLVVMTGQRIAPLATQLMACHLRYYWMLAYLVPGGSEHLFQVRVRPQWKPLLWFVRDDYQGGYVSDVVSSPEPDKAAHQWGQSELGMAEIIERFSNPGELVVDPFCGGGSTGVAALRLGRRFLGADIDGRAVATALGRLAEVIA